MSTGPVPDRCNTVIRYMITFCSCTSPDIVLTIPLNRAARLELGDFSEIEIADFHGRNNHIERLFAAGSYGFAHFQYVI